MIKTLIFDLDDTLYNEEKYVLEAFKEVVKYLSKKYDINKEVLYKEVLNTFYKEGRGKIFNIICNKHDFNENIDELVEIYRNAKPKLKLYKDAENLLKWARENKFKLGIITDGCSKVQWNKINSLKLKNKIDKIVVTDDLGKEYWKPHSKSYLEIIKFFKCSNEECVYIGDNPNKDFIGAKRLGLKTIRIIRKNGDHMRTFLDNEYEAELNIKSLDEIKILLSKR